MLALLNRGMKCWPIRAMYVQFSGYALLAVALARPLHVGSQYLTSVCQVSDSICAVSVFPKPRRPKGHLTATFLSSSAQCPHSLRSNDKWQIYFIAMLLARRNGSIVQLFCKGLGEPRAAGRRADVISLWSCIVSWLTCRDLAPVPILCHYFCHFY